MARRYKTVDQILPELEDMINDLIKSNVKILPSERSLIEQIGTSRMTLRKALSSLAERGLIDDRNGVRLLNTTPNAPSKTVSVAYVAQGSGYPQNPVWYRLGCRLEHELKTLNVNYKAVYYDWQNTDQIWPGNLDKIPDIIVITDIVNPEIRSRIMALRNQALIIAVDEDYTGKCECLVSLNNYRAGYLAAQRLLESGAKNPAVLYCDKENLPFYRRRDGFIDALYEAGIKAENNAYATSSGTGLSSIEKNIAQAKEILKNGHDGLFLFTDESAQMIRDLIAQTYKIPEEFKLITLFATGNCQQDGLLVDAVDHAIDGSVAKLIEIITAISNNMPFEKINLIEPEIIHGNTLK